MLGLDPLFEAHERGRQLRADAVAERLRRPTVRRLLAATLRRAADRLDAITQAELEAVWSAPVELRPPS